MKDERKTKKQLIEEIHILRQRVRELELKNPTERHSENGRDVPETGTDVLKKGRQSPGLRQGKLRRITDGVDDVIFESDLELNLSYVTPSVETFLGYSPEEFLTVHFSEALTPKSWEKVRKVLSEILNGENKGQLQLDLFPTLDLEYRKKNGDTVWGEARLFLRKDKEGKAAGLHGVMRGISQEMEAEVALINAESQLSSITNSFPSQIVLLGPDFKIQYANRPLVGRSRGELAGLHARDTVPQGDWERIKGIFDKVRETGVGDSFVFSLGREDGPGATFEVQVGPVLGAEGKFAGYVTNTLDITDRIISERKLEENERKYRRLVETLQEGVWLVDEENRTVFVNRSMARMLGYSVDEMLGKPIFDFMGRDEIRDAQRKFEKRRRGKEVHHERILLARDGSPVHVLISSSPIVSEEGIYQGSLAGIVDISELKTVREDLTQTSEVLATILESTPVSIAYMDGDFNLIWVNKAYADADEKDPGYFIGKNHFDLFPNEENERIFREVVRSGTPHYEHASPSENVFRQGRGVSWWNWSLIPIRTGEGPVTHALLTMQNVSQSILADQAVKESEENFRQLAETIEDVFWITDDRFEKAIYVSPLFEEMWGLTFEVLSSAMVRVLEVVVEEDRQSLMESIKTFRSGNFKGGETAIEFRISHPEKGIRWIRTRAFPVPGPGGNMTRIVGVSSDITERVETGKKIRESEERLSVFMDSATDIFVLLDEDLKITDLNRAAVESWYEPLKKQDFIGRSIYDLFPEGSACKPGFDRYREVIRSGVPLRMNGSQVAESRGRRIYDIKVFKAGRGLGVIATDITEMGNMANAIKDREARFRQLFEKSPDAIILADPETGFILDCNPRTEDLLLKSNDEIIGMDHSELHPPDVREKSRELFKEHLQKGEDAGPSEIEIIRSDGVTVPVEIRASTISMGGKDIAMGVFRDVTSRNVAEKALLLSEERMRLLLESTQDLIFMQDRDGKYLYSSGLRRYGIDNEDLVGKSPYDIHDRDTAGMMVDRVRRAMDGGETITEEVMINWEGEDLWFLDQVSPVRDLEGQIIAASTISRNITLIKEAERAVLESERRYRGLVEGTDDLITIVDGEGRITFANPSCERIFGCSPRECRGLAVFDFVHPEDRKRTMEWFRNTVARRVRTATIENRNVNRKTGESFDLLWRVSFNYDEGSSGLEAISIAHDITDRKKLEMSLLHSEKLESLGILAGGIAHDFNNLLMGIMGNVGLAQLKLAADSPVQEDLRRAEHTARVAADLTNQMLAFTGKGAFDVRTVNLSSAIGEMAQLLRAAVPANVQLISELAGDLPAIEADVSQVQQVAMNLITNASDAIEGQEGSVKVTTGAVKMSAAEIAKLDIQVSMKPGMYVFLEVADTGSGIKPEARVKLFEPFYSSKPKGRGLGLASVRGILKAHNGGLALESIAGRGSTFTVYFPLSGKIAKEDSVSTDQPEKWQKSGTILVVDDEESVRAVAKSMLEQNGFSVICASDGREGVKAFEAARDEIVMIILDLTMPVMNGEAAFKEVRRIDSEVPIIVISGYAETDSMREPFGNDARVQFLQKPFMPEDLNKKMVRLFNLAGEE